MGITVNGAVTSPGTKTVCLLFADHAHLCPTFMVSEHGASSYQVFCQQWKRHDLADTLRERAFLLPQKGAP